MRVTKIGLRQMWVLFHVWNWYGMVRATLDQGSRHFFVWQPSFLNTCLSNEARMLYFWKCDQSFIYKLIFQYYLENVSNVYWTRCLYILIQIQMSNKSKIRQSIFDLLNVYNYLFIPISFCPTTCTPNLFEFITIN